MPSIPKNNTPGRQDNGNDTALLIFILATTILLWLAHASYAIYYLFFDDSREPPSVSQMFSH